MGGRKDGQSLPPTWLVSLVDNESLKGANPANVGNRGLNSNAHSITTIRRTAELFKGGVNKTSTGLILMPTEKGYGTAKPFAERALAAVNATTIDGGSDDPDDKQVRSCARVLVRAIFSSAVP